MLLTSLVLMLLALGSYALRKLTPGGHVFHTPWGAALISILSASLAAGIKAIQGSGLHGDAIAQAVAAALLSLLATSNPSAPSAPGDAPSVPPSAAALALIIAFAASACGHAPPAAAAFGKAYGACMEARGLSAAPGVAEEAWADLQAGAGSAQSIEQQLEGLGLKAGEDAVACAVIAWLGSNPVQPDGGVAPAQAAARVYLARHAKALKH